MISFSKPTILPRHHSAFTLLELVIVISILGLLATFVFPSLELARQRAEKVVCIGNLRSLHASLNSYLIDNKRWPQVPEEFTVEQAAQFWVGALKDYGTTPAVWTCPTLRRKFNEDPSKFAEYPSIHYTPAEFDEKPSTPTKWPTMPWVMEIASMHGDGNFLIRADGGIKELDELIREANGASSYQMK